MFLGTSLGTVASARVGPWTAIVDPSCIGVDTGGARISRGCMVCGAGDATLGVMGTSTTSSIDGRLLNLSLFPALFAALGALSVGVVAVNPGALRGTGACMTVGGVGERTGVALSSGSLPG